MTGESRSDRERQMAQDSLDMAIALHTVASESNDAESVRIAMAALTNTSMGAAYLESHPLRY